MPDDDPRWLEVLDHFLAAMKAERIGGTYWAAGGWWGKYPLSVEPRDGRDRPQMEVLRFYAGDRQKPKDAKPSYADAAAKMKRVPPRTVEKKTLPAGTERTVYDFGRRQESYHYSNDGSEYRSEALEDGDRQARRIVYRHQGKIAWVGVGLYFGGLDCTATRLSSLPCGRRRRANWRSKPTTLTRRCTTRSSRLAISGRNSSLVRGTENRRRQF